MVVAVEGGVVAGGSDIFGGAFDDDGRVGLREGCRLAGSGLDSAALLVLVFWCRRRSVEEGRFSVASSCWARLRFDFRLADLSVAAAGVLTGLNP